MSVLSDSPAPTPDELTQRTSYDTPHAAHTRYVPGLSHPANPHSLIQSNPHEGGVHYSQYTQTPHPGQQGYDFSLSPPPSFANPHRIIGAYPTYGIQPVPNLQYHNPATYPEDPELRRLAVEFEERRQALERNQPALQSGPPAGVHSAPPNTYSTSCNYFTTNPLSIFPANLPKLHRLFAPSGASAPGPHSFR